MSEKIEAQIKKVAHVLVSDLTIPDYQRPYRWQEENVRQLLQDIYESWKSGKQSYRIGSVILHTENGTQLNIVDGQQRITTLLLVLKTLDSPIGKELCNALKYNHIDSKNAIISNAQFIKRWISENIHADVKEFEKYLTQYCELVEIKVQDLSEAFQMFDSQNGRGKELEAYNLLKAYHIRAMEANSFEEKIVCDRNWEKATRFDKKAAAGNDNLDILNQLFNEQLYRIRVWSRKEIALSFSKKEIAEFKGATINKENAISHPFQNKELLHYIAQNYFHTIGVDVKGIKNRFNKNHFENINPFVLVNEKIVNGKHFFEYIETYVEIYKQLYLDGDSTTLEEFKTFYNSYCKGYHGAHRDGDKYLLELYKSLVFIVFDKFGEDGVNKFYKILYAAVYRERLGKVRVYYPATAKYPAKNSLFHTIEKAQSFAEMRHLEQIAYAKIECRKEVKEILECFTLMGIPIFTNDTKIDLKKYSTKWN